MKLTVVSFKNTNKQCGIFVDESCADSLILKNPDNLTKHYIETDENTDFSFNSYIVITIKRKGNCVVFDRVFSYYDSKVCINTKFDKNLNNSKKLVRQETTLEIKYTYKLPFIIQDENEKSNITRRVKVHIDRLLSHHYNEIDLLRIGELSLSKNIENIINQIENEYMDMTLTLIPKSSSIGEYTCGLTYVMDTYLKNKNDYIVLLNYYTYLLDTRCMKNSEDDYDFYIRLPGATRGAIKCNDDMVITKIHIISKTSSCYCEDIQRILEEKYIGYKIKFL